MAQLRLLRRQRFKRGHLPRTTNAPSSPPTTPTTTRHTTTPIQSQVPTPNHRSLWAEPAYIPSEYLSSSSDQPPPSPWSPSQSRPSYSPMPMIQGHHRQLKQDLPPPGQILYPDPPSPIYPPLLNPYPTNNLNVTLTKSPLNPNPIPNFVYDRYPHLTQSYLLFQYAPLSF